MTAITLNLEPIIKLTHEQFYKLCMANKDVAMEHSPEGELILMSPDGLEITVRIQQCPLRAMNRIFNSNGLIAIGP
jgi:Uma2 family endonuclease